MEDFDLKKYITDKVLLREDHESQKWEEMGEEERLYTLLSYVDDPAEAESYVDLSFHDLPDHVEAHVFDDIDEAFDPEGDYNIKYEIEDYEIGDEVVVLPILSHDPINKQGETGVVKDTYPEDDMVQVEFDDGKLGYYMAGWIVFPGDENYIHPEDEGSMNEDFDLREYLKNNPLLAEGQFSWMTMDTDEQIGSEKENIIDVYMVDNKGNSYHEPKYDGYGNFGGKDYYDVLATMNGFTQEDVGIKTKKGFDTTELRSIGINLAFGEIEPKGGEVLFPALVTDPDMVGSGWDFTKQPENDPNQSWATEEEEDDNDYYDDEDYDDDDDEY